MGIKFMFTQWSGESEPCNAVLIEKQVKSTVRISLVTLSPVCNLNDEGGHSVHQHRRRCCCYEILGAYQIE